MVVMVGELDADVQRDLLDTDEVLAAREGLGERKGEARLGCIVQELWRGAQSQKVCAGSRMRDVQVEGKVSWPLAYVGACS